MAEASVSRSNWAENFFAVVVNGPREQQLSFVPLLFEEISVFLNRPILQKHFPKFLVSL